MLVAMPYLKNSMTMMSIQAIRMNGLVLDFTINNATQAQDQSLINFLGFLTMEMCGVVALGNGETQY